MKLTGSRYYTVIEKLPSGATLSSVVSRGQEVPERLRQHVPEADHGLFELADTSSADDVEVAVTEPAESPEPPAKPAKTTKPRRKRRT